MILYLASQSPRRKAILKELKIPFRAAASAYRENDKQKKPPARLALEHACGKAKQAVVPASARYVLGADTVVYAAKQILSKPADKKEAMKMLGILSGKTHAVYTAVAIWDRLKKKMWTGCEKTRVTIKPMTKPEMEQYIALIHPYDKAGGYAIQKKPVIVKKISGSYSNVVGFPTELFLKMLNRIRKAG